MPRRLAQGTPDRCYLRKLSCRYPRSLEPAKDYRAATDRRSTGFKLIEILSSGYRRNMSFVSDVVAPSINPMERLMKKILIATALTLMCSSAFAQTSTGPGNQGDSMNKPGMTNNSNSGMSNSGTSNSGTTGSSMSKDSKDSMHKDGMKNDSMSKDGMKKDGMSK
jgi:pentapeptide MXKDX repeat protein